ncbi:MAG: Alpha/beta hydrolase [Acidimicrobiales bacterium]|nr:Alpha/beta hydrolase [Acidimicrobiales bacterium]
MASMPSAKANGIEIFYETFGDPEDPPLLLVMGLGAQMISWPDDLCLALVGRGFHVIRFDNRDVGLSTHLDRPDLDVPAAIAAALTGGAAQVPYLLSDMAADAVGLLDALDIDAAYLVGASMGGMIAQTVAIEHPERVLGLTSIMSTTGEHDVGQADPAVLLQLMAPTPTQRDAAIAHDVEVDRAIASPEHFDEDERRDLAARSYDRAFDPLGTARQLLAIVMSPSRAEGLGALDVPTLVVHGRQDPLVGLSGGQRTAELVPGAELLVIDDMGHDLPPAHWAQIIEAITSLAVRARR